MFSQDKDIETIKRIQSGDINAFGDIVERYKDSAYSLTLKIIRNKDEAEDTLQDAFIKLFKAIVEKKYETKAKFSTYFYTIVYNTAVDYYRKYTSKRFNITSIDITDANFKEGDELLRGFQETKIDDSVAIEDSQLSPDKNAAGNEINNIIYKYINSIPEHYSVILNMFYINQLSHYEIAEILKIPEGTVKNRIFRAKEKLKTLLLLNYSEEELLEYI
jgi:RNA polymerase sigma-70 factor (ECF subfamily)